MAKLDESADALLAWAGQVQGFIAVAEELKALGSLEQARKEREDAADQAQTKLAQANEQLATVTASIKAAEQRAADTGAQANASAAQIVSAARQQAEDIIKKARDDAASISNAAAADEKTAQDAAIADLDRITGLTNEKRAELAALNEQVAASTAEHDRLVTAMQTMRENAKAIAG